MNGNGTGNSKSNGSEDSVEREKYMLDIEGNGAGGGTIDPPPYPLWGTRQKQPVQESPPLRYAGVEDVFRLGQFGVDGNAALLRRYEFIQRKLVYLEAAHVPSRTRYELKPVLGKHLYEDAQATAALRERFSQLRQNPNALNRIPDQRLALLMDELLHASSDAELLLGLYEVLKPALLEAYEWHMRATHQLADQPTIRILRQICWDLEQQIHWGEQAIAEWVDAAGERPEATEFKEKMQELRAAAGGITGQQEGAGTASPKRWRSQTPFSFPEKAIRDERFTAGTVHYRSGAPEHAEDLTEERLYWFMRIRQEEIEVVELLGSVIWQNQHMPWDFTADVARHLWDEARHSMLGQAVLESDGVDWMSYPQHTSIYDSHIDRVASDQYAYLWAIESMQMPRGGKRAEYELAQRAEHPLATQVQDYDWADEVVHVHLGRERVPELYDNDADLAWRAGQQALDEWWSVTEGAQEGHRLAVGSMRPGSQGAKGY